MSSTSRAPAPDGKPMTGRFVVERRLGEGSMGAVYLAHDRARGAKVALKTLRRVDASGIYRFKREFRALADVSHPNLVALHELFSEGTDWFFTMEYVEGQDLLTYVLGAAQRTTDFSARERKRELRSSRRTRAGSELRGMEVLFPTPLSDPDRLRHVLRQVVQAVIALHAAGKLHRDLKPDNVMVTAEGRAVVLDFGIAAERDRDLHGTMEAGVMGTPAYMSPEQAAGADVTEATDWYALGAILYEALTGQVPFDGTYTEVLQQKQQEDPPAPSQLVSGAPGELEILCMRLLSRDPAARPSGAEILDALGTLPSGVSLPRAVEARTPFVGRAHEIAELSRALAATDDGTPSLVFVHGMTGMGKTALVERFLDSLGQSDAVTLSGRCYEHEMVPFKALDSVVDSLSRYLCRIAAIDAAEVLPKDIHALAQLFPVLERVEVVRMARRRGRMAPDPRTQQRQAMLALKELLARVAMRQPLVVFIDDLQWGDVDSARVLAELLSGRERPHMLLVCTYRSADKEPSPCLSTLLELMRGRDQTSVREISVEALSASEAIELSALLLEGEDRSQSVAVARESRGNPYLLSQLVEHLRGGRTSAPELESGIRVSLEHALLEQLSGLSRDASTVLELVVVSGRPVREQVLANIADGEINVPAALTELRRIKLVRGVGAPDARAIGIYHDRIRDSVLARMDATVIRDWHTRLATAVEQAEPLDVEALIEHLVGSGDNARAGIYAIAAARQAVEALAFNKAADLYEIAVEHLQDEAWQEELLVHLADALVSAGRSTRAAEVYLKAAERMGERESAGLRLKAGTQLMLAGGFQRGVEVLTPALAELGLKFPASDTEALSVVVELLPELQRRGFAFEENTDRELSPQTVARLDALWTLVQAMFTTTPILAQVFVLHHLREALEAGDKRRIVVGLCAYFISIDVAYSSLGGKKPESLSQAEALCRDLYDPRCRAWVALARGFAFQNEGMLKPASLDFAQAEDLFHNHCGNVAAELRACRLLYARSVALMGKLDEIGMLEQWIRDAIECEDVTVVARLRLHLIPRMLMDGEIEQVQRALALPERVPEEGIGLTHLMRLIGGSQLALYLGDGSELANIAARMGAVGRSPLLVIRVWRSDFLLARARTLLAASEYADDPEPMLAKTEKIVSAVATLGLDCHADHLRLLRAGLHRRKGERDHALEQLDAIISDADTGGEGRVILACARIRKGQMLGGDAGSALVRDGLHELKTRGAAEPVPFARLHAPGWGDPA